ncbi:MAG: crossover junction endodeoxyribonuclease RuvC, partial [Firmicutes bacterium]|nr:crossover junction endodeoxyribonuclease RuvC [Bacillota bacterium]
MKILGIDPGYAIMGYGIIEKDGNVHRLIDYGVLTTDKDMSMPDRLKTLYNGLMDIIAEHQPEEAAIEQLYFNTNQTTAIFVGQARGVAILACANNGLEIYEYTP